MNEYLVHIWGGAWNDNASPSIKEDYGINSGYHYFQDKQTKDKFISILNQTQYKNQGLMIDESYGEMSHKRTIFVYQLEYNGKIYELEHDFGYEFKKEHAIFMFEQGNYSCDCNKSLFIQNEYGEEEIDELNCGDKIKLKLYYFRYDD